MTMDTEQNGISLDEEFRKMLIAIVRFVNDEEVEECVRVLKDASIPSRKNLASR